MTRQIVGLVELLPVKAVLALHIADGVDEEDQKRGTGHFPGDQVLPIQTSMFGEPLADRGENAAVFTVRSGVHEGAWARPPPVRPSRNVLLWAKRLGEST